MVRVGLGFDVGTTTLVGIAVGLVVGITVGIVVGDGFSTGTIFGCDIGVANN